MNYFKGEYVCKNRNASNWRNKPVDFYVLYKSFSKIGVLDTIKEKNEVIKVEKTMTMEQKEKKLYDDCMADPKVEGSWLKGTKEEQCTDSSWYAWFMNIIDKVKEYLLSVVK